ncbi:ribosomal protein L1p/L10e family-domain-containing protein [Clohesyomyces aquaticus]|uniref:Ribosomal protein L1p/L10e family-domain-containing protein n=1 Tax=Clohesyomyces aquaticus TaxID=1231657 RepID=A0A1Y1ZIF9_9PLEO|nr:ribosomal protein L1p/L10e family-domain-containing protein [Clohesyomyces aquaticus]
MAKSAVAKVAQTDAPLTTKVAKGSPYQLDPSQVERAAKGLLGNMKKHAADKKDSAEKKNLLAADNDEAEEEDAPVFLNLTTKTHVKDENRLKPNKISLPHAIQPKELRICLITSSPQREFKDLVEHESFPEDLRAKIGRVMEVDKLRRKIKSYEQKRALLAEYDLFLADERIVTILPKALGKVFYSSKTKRPMPVCLTRQKKETKTRVTATPEELARSIEGALKSTPLNLSSSVNTTIKIGTMSMTAEQISQNVDAVVAALTTKFIPKGWRNIRALHIKGPTTMSLPIWLADELWVDEEQVLDQPWQQPVKDGPRISEKKRKYEEWENELMDEEELAERRSRSRKSRKQQAVEDAPKETNTISKERRKRIKSEAMASVATPLVVG